MRPLGLTTCPMMVILLVMFSVFCLIPPVSSQISTVVAVEPSTVSTQFGDSFTVNLSISGVQNLYGLEIVLTWNPAVLRVANMDIRLGVETFSDGVLHESPSSPHIFIAENNLTQTRGEYRLVATSMAPAPSFNGSGKIVKITFESTKPGDSTLDLESQLYDYPPEDRDPRIAFPITHSTHDSIVTVKTSTDPTPTPEPTPAPSDNAPPEITFISPANQVYNESSVSFIFTVNEPLNWTGYSLDSEGNVTVTGNFTLTHLSNGLHKVTVYGNDTLGNMGISETLTFTVAVAEPEPEPFPIAPVAAASAVVALATGVSSLLYFKKRKRKA